MRAVGLFSGIGGIELGLLRAGICTELLCEYWEPAASTLRRHFEVPIVGDIRDLKELPRVDVVAAGFPCTDLSQVGRTAGIEGAESGLVREVFRLIGETPPTWLVLENVPNMLTLHGGAPIRRITLWLEEHGWNWAYRTVDSQYFGVRQRRRRVFLVASRSEDPRTVLYADESPTRWAARSHHAYGFSWTEGNRGLGWGEGVTPTLKGGSKIGIASPPGVWLPGAEVGKAVVRPSIRAGERLQGFKAGWTDHLAHEGVRWKLLGNAVTVPVAEWIGRRLSSPGRTVDVPRSPMLDSRWAPSAASIRGRREVWDLGECPLERRRHLTLAELLAEHGSTGLSSGATRGFVTRLQNSTLRYRPAFLEALWQHVRHLAAN